MGCWGITAFQSDTGLDAIEYIRKALPTDGKLKLSDALSVLKKEKYIEPVTSMWSHTGPMALAELYFKFVDKDISNLDYDEEWAKDDNKFSSLKSFVADKDTLKFLRDYIENSLNYCVANAHYANSWFKQENWFKWQDHMKNLVNRLDEHVNRPEALIEVMNQAESENTLEVEDNHQMG